MHKNKVKTFLFVSFLFCLCCMLNVALANDIETEVSRYQIAMGETVTVSYRINSLNRASRPDFSPLTKDFRIVGSNRNMSIDMINGVTNAKTIWKVVLEPLRTGELLIPEISFGQLKSTPRKLLVEEAPAGINLPADTQTDAVFVKAEISDLSPYVESQVIYTFKLYYNAQLQNPTIEPPRIKESNLEPIGDDKYYETIIKGERYYVFEKRFAIFPHKAGKLTIPPAHFRALQVDNSLNFMNPFPMMNNQPITLSTPAFTVNVQGVPTHFQGKIWLPAKSISLTEDWSAKPYHWETGNPITRTITIETQGLRAEQIPDLSVGKIDGVNIYADPPHRTNNLHGNTVIGTCQQKITYIPNQPQSFTIPALQLKWWNTQTNSQESANLKAIPVEVRGKVTQSEAAPINNTPVTVADINKPIDGREALQPTSIKQTQVFYLSIWFWLACALFFLWLITLWLLWRKKTPKSSNSQSPVVKEILNVIDTQRFSEKAFIKACEQGDIILAQKLILSWAKTQWQNPPRSLGKLSEVIDDETFKQAIKRLERVLYTNASEKWRGHDLLTAFRQVKQKKNPHSLSKSKARRPSKDPLPPLNP